MGLPCASSKAIAPMVEEVMASCLIEEKMKPSVGGLLVYHGIDLLY